MTHTAPRECGAAIIVRPVTLEGILGALPLLQAAERHSGPANPTPVEEQEEELRRALTTDSFWLLLAELEGQAVGCASLVRIPKLDRRHGFLFLDELYVAPEFRQMGVATQLLGAAQELARREACAGVRLLVRPANEAARAVYRRLHYVEHDAILCELRDDPSA
jgi:ribosomal protein S18 acetylase RimI-like enzyme